MLRQDQEDWGVLRQDQEGSVAPNCWFSRATCGVTARSRTAWMGVMCVRPSKQVHALL